MKFVYHMVPKGFEGDMLYPLNQLKAIKSELAAEHAKKYADRKGLPERRIPLLDCLWNDVLMFSPVHPAEIMQTFRKANYDLNPKDFFEIPLSVFEPERTAVYFPSLKKEFGDFTIDPDQVAMLADANFDELTILGDKLEQHIEHSRNDGRNPVMFGNIPHILHLGPISLEGVKTVNY